jgi:hypothetical protein
VVKTILKRLSLALIVLMLVGMTFPELLLIPWALGFGWIGSLVRLVPHLSPSLGALSMALIGLLVLIVGTHWFCAWLHQRLQSADGANGSGWPWKWTLALHGGLWLVFFAVMGIVGIVHQVAWMAASGEPVFVSGKGRWKARAALNIAAVTLRMAADEAGWSLAKTQAGFWNSDSGSGKAGDPVWEQHQVIFLSGDGDRLAAAIVIPRDPRWRKQAGLVMVQPEGKVAYERETKLPEILARHQNVAFRPPP